MSKLLFVFTKINIIGMCEGLGLGTNAMSALVTRGCGEMRRLGIKLGAQPSTIAGLSGKLLLRREGGTIFILHIVRKKIFETKSD